MEQLEKIIKETLSEVDEELIGTTCGSYRRGAESSGDVLPYSPYLLSVVGC
jgi:DNA polymerase beta